MPAISGLTGAQVSRRMLDSGGLSDVRVEGIQGNLSDHYDPRTRLMRLSPAVGGSSSVAAVAVAAHETGHAFQDARHEAGFRARGALVPGGRVRLAGVVSDLPDRVLRRTRPASP